MCRTYPLALLLERVQASFQKTSANAPFGIQEETLAQKVHNATKNMQQKYTQYPILGTFF
jgi:hypothetical protein